MRLILIAFIVFTSAIGWGISDTFSESANVVNQCPKGELYNPTKRACFPINDEQDSFKGFMDVEFKTQAEQALMYRHQPETLQMMSLPPIPGGIGSGTLYRKGHYCVENQAIFAASMIVQMNGLNTPEWVFTTETNRTANTLEVVGIYGPNSTDGALGIFDWSCSPSSPCQDGQTEPSWIITVKLDAPILSCYIDFRNDAGGHPHHFVFFANSSRKLSDGNPDLWENTAHLWNYCQNSWTLAYRHEFTANQEQCCTSNNCAWWGPIVEEFHDLSVTIPSIPEIGFEDAQLYVDGIWHFLERRDARFVNPPNHAPSWQIFHRNPNRSYGVGGHTGNNP